MIAFLLCFLVFLPSSLGAERAVEDVCPSKALEAYGAEYFKVHGDLCFLFAVHNKTWHEEAIAKCGKNGGALAMPKTKDLNDFLVQEWTDTYSSTERFWIGLSDTITEGEVIWQDGSELDWTNWGHTSQGFTQRWKDCAAVEPRDGTWHSHNCWTTGVFGTNPKPFVCQYAEGAEGNSVGVTDDGEDIEPAVEDVCPPKALEYYGSEYFKVYGDLCFLFAINEGTDFEEARDECKLDDGILAMPKTKDINDFLVQELRFTYSAYDKLWIGMNDTVTEKEQVWQDGSKVEWSNFDYYTNGRFANWEDCVALDPRDGTWHDFHCWTAGAFETDPRGFICQYDRLPSSGDEVLPDGHGNSTSIAVTDA